MRPAAPAAATWLSARHAPTPATDTFTNTHTCVCTRTLTHRPGTGDVTAPSWQLAVLDADSLVRDSRSPVRDTLGLPLYCIYMRVLYI